MHDLPIQNVSHPKQTHIWPSQQAEQWPGQYLFSIIELGN